MTEGYGSYCYPRGRKLRIEAPHREWVDWAVKAVYGYEAAIALLKKHAEVNDEIVDFLEAHPSLSPPPTKAKPLGQPPASAPPAAPRPGEPGPTWFHSYTAALLQVGLRSDLPMRSDQLSRADIRYQDVQDWKPLLDLAQVFAMTPHGVWRDLCSVLRDKGY